MSAAPSTAGAVTGTADPVRATRKSKRKKAPTSKDLTTPPRKYRKEAAPSKAAGESEMKLNVWVSGVSPHSAAAHG